MKLDISQCRSAKKTAALGALRRSARISSSFASSSSPPLQEQGIVNLFAGTHCLTLLQLTAFSSPFKAPRKARTLKKRELSKGLPLEVSAFAQPQQVVRQTLESLPQTQFPRQESFDLDDGIVSTCLLKQRSFNQHKTLLTQRSFKQDSTGLEKQKSFNLDISTGAGISRQTSLKIEALIEPSRVLSRTSSCTTIGRKRVVGVDDFAEELELPSCGSPSTPPTILEHDFSPRKKFASPRTPSTCLDRSPSASLTISELKCSPKWSPTSTSPKNFGLCFLDEGCSGDSLLEELPFDLLLRIVCCLEHADLKPVSLVCKRLLSAVSIARHYHFSYTTPRRERKGKRAQIFLSSEDQTASLGGLAAPFIRPPTPNAPRQSGRPELRFYDSSPLTSPCLESPGAVHTIKSSRTGLVLHRVLFDEDELCEAVAHNSL